MKRILLIGIGGVYNYGCEAIVRGTVNILKSLEPTIEVYYASYNAEDDKRRLAGCDVNIIARPPKKRWTLRNIIRKCLSVIGITYSIPYDKIDWIKDFDTVFSIGGDIYTLSPTDEYDSSFPLYLEKCQNLGLKYILWGASVGKFEKNVAALNFFRVHLSKIDTIVSREQNTIDYLHSLGLTKNVFLAPDPAFFVQDPDSYADKKREDKLTIGINLSPLSALYEYKDIETAIQRQSNAIVSLMRKMNCRVILLPHVISPNPQDNDLTYMNTIRNHIEQLYQTDIEIIDNDPGFIGLKKYIRQCDYVIAARMHCAVNAVTQSVSTLFLSYSEKAKGMAEFVYDSKSAVISLSEFENTELIVEKLKNWNLISRLENIRQFDFSKILDIEK